MPLSAVRSRPCRSAAAPVKAPLLCPNRADMRKWYINLPDEALAYFPDGTDHFDDYVEAVGWAQDFAALNRRMMMANVIAALRGQIAKPFDAELEAVNCHHNYVTREHHFGENVLVTRKGAVRAAKGVMGIIPGSMGAKSFIVRGLGNPESFDSCSHGAGRVMQRRNTSAGRPGTGLSHCPLKA